MAEGMEQREPVSSHRGAEMGEKKDHGQSGGVNISGWVGSVGGDIVGRDKVIYGPNAQSADSSRRDQVQSTNLTIDSGGAQESIIDILREEVKIKNDQIHELTNENKHLLSQKGSIESIFQMVGAIIGEHSLTVNDYISYTCLFLMKMELGAEFKKCLPEKALKLGNKQ
jgi:hypothetical protein